MSGIVDFLADLERAVQILSNIVLLVYSVVMTIKMKKWKETAHFVVKGVQDNNLEQLEKGAPKKISANIQKLVKNVKNQESK